MHLLVRTEDLTRFMAKVCLTDTCWTWTGAQMGGGRMGKYGVFWVSSISQNVYAHRWSYAYTKGEIPEDLVVDHLCRNRLCVRPSHLEVVTYEVNRERSSHTENPKTSCPNGHPYDMVDSQNSRRCTRCKNEKKREWYQRNAEAINAKRRVNP